MRTTAPRRPASRWHAVVRWGTTLATLGVATIGMYAVRGTLDKAHVTLVFLLIVLGASAVGGRTLGLTVAGLAFLCFDFFFLVPYGTLTISNPLDWLVLVAFLITSAVAAQLLYRATATADAANQRAIRVARRAPLGAETLNAADAEQALCAIAQVIRKSVHADACEIYLRSLDGHTRLVTPAVRIGATRGDADEKTPRFPEIGFGEVQHAASKPGSLVEWIIEHGTSAVELIDGTVRVAQDLSPPMLTTEDQGWGVQRETATTLRVITDSEDRSVAGRLRAILGIKATRLVAPAYPAVRALALPLQVRDHTVGVLRIMSDTPVTLTPAEARLLVALAYYAALGAERARLVATAERAEAERRVEALRSALLTSVSHDLRTPLTTIKGIAHEILHGSDIHKAAVIEGEVDRLDAMISDLLDLSRIQARAVQPALAINTVDDLLGAALRGTSGAFRDHPIHIDVPEAEFLAGLFDFTQTLRILINLLDNAAKYSPPGSPVDVQVRRTDDRLTIAIMDRGPGVPTSEQNRIFEPFYRPPGVPPDVRGHGLGLSIALGLAEAQGGTVHFDPRPGGGSVFTLELPAADTRLPDLHSTEWTKGTTP